MERAGYIHPRYLNLVPGVGKWNYGRTWRVPYNMLPPLHDPAKRGLSYDAVCPASGLVLRNYQIEALEFLHAAQWCALIALDVGLGKTVVALMAHHLHGREMGEAMRQKPFLVVGPLIASSAWLGSDADPAVHFGYKVAALRTRNPQKYMEQHHDEIAAAQGYFINHEILPQWKLHVQNWGVRTVIVDESHLLRGGQTQSAQAFSGVMRSKGVTTRVALTATPIVSSVADLFTQLDFVAPDSFGWWGEFVTRYAGAHPNEYTQYALGDETNVPELRQRLSRVLLRRSRFDARKELPAFERQLAQLDFDVLDGEIMARYKEIEEDFVASVEEKGDTVNYQGLPLQQIVRMAALLAEAKRPFAAQEALNMARANGAVVVGTWYKDTAKHVAEALRKEGVEVFGPISSETTKARRDKAAEAFKQAAQRHAHSSLRLHDPAAFVATLGTSGMSMNQLAASPCGLCCEMYWVPMVLLQWEGRIHREGQLAAACFVRYLVARNTIDTIMFKHLQRKARTIERIAQDPEAASLCETLGGPDATAKRDFATLCAALAGIEGTGEQK